MREELSEPDSQTWRQVAAEAVNKGHGLERENARLRAALATKEERVREQREVGELLDVAVSGFLGLLRGLQAADPDSETERAIQNAEGARTKWLAISDTRSGDE